MGGAACDYRLQLHGRYCHSRGYVERLLGGAGLTPEIAQAELRMESGAPVAGLVIRATKSLGPRVAGTSVSGGADEGVRAMPICGERDA